MQIDFSQVLTELDGETPISSFETLDKVAMFALLNMGPNDNTEGSLKVKRGHLAMRIYGATEPLDVTVEDIADLKGLIGRLFSPLIVVRAFDIIEGVKSDETTTAVNSKHSDRGEPSTRAGAKGARDKA